MTGSFHERVDKYIRIPTRQFCTRHLPLTIRSDGHQTSRSTLVSTNNANCHNPQTRIGRARSAKPIPRQLILDLSIFRFADEACSENIKLFNMTSCM